MSSSVYIPPPLPYPFRNGIRHPELWLWDSWTAVRNGAEHLFCLALNRQNRDGTPIMPADRNRHRFHIRHFRSEDAGRTWWDEGAFFVPMPSGDGARNRNIWSGSVLPTADGWLTALTGIRELGEERPFLQSLFVMETDIDGKPRFGGDTALSCPMRDYDRIRDAGYYLAGPDVLGHRDGEENGPILSWRDPFLHRTDEGELHLFWTAKMAPARPALGHARIVRTRHCYEIARLYPPVGLPDGETFTQSEVPKIYPDPQGGGYFLLISACNRLHEAQSDSEIEKGLRLYHGPSLRGPWRFWNETACLSGPEHGFGASLLDLGSAQRPARLIAPITEFAASADRLTIAPVYRLELDRHRPPSGLGRAAG